MPTVNILQVLKRDLVIVKCMCAAMHEREHPTFMPIPLDACFLAFYIELFEFELVVRNFFLLSVIITRHETPYNKATGSHWDFKCVILK